MPFVIERPCWARAEGVDEADLRRHLTYTDQRIVYKIKRFERGQGWYIQKHGAEAYQAELEDLKAKRKPCLVRVDDDGTVWIPAGHAEDLGERMGHQVYDQIGRERFKTLPWAKKLDREPRPYQREAVDKLIAARHGGVELATGLGKTMIILLLLREMGLPAVVTSPFGAIARQTYREACEFLGKGKVGLYGAGKQDLKKQITISTAQALQRIKPDSDKADVLRRVKVFIFDESHMTAADTLSHVCLDLMADAPYRFFLSGTQLRADGLQKLLDGITGPILMRMSVGDGVRGGYLARPQFKVLEVPGMVRVKDDRDAQLVTRAAIYHNPRVIGAACGLANQMVAAGRKVLIMVDELDQYAKLVPYLRHRSEFAHAGAGDEMKKVVPQAFWNVDPLEQVDRFNAGEFPILVGTSCIGTGVDVRIPGCGIWLRGGASEIDLRQGVGRLVRKAEGKQDFVWFDFDPVDVELAHRHAEKRAGIYEDIWNDVVRVRLGG